MKTLLLLLLTLSFSVCADGFIDPQTGKYYPAIKGGAIDPQTGQFYPEVGQGYVNPNNGSYRPRISQGNNYDDSYEYDEYDTEDSYEYLSE